MGGLHSWCVGQAHRYRGYGPGWAVRHGRGLLVGGHLRKGRECGEANPAGRTTRKRYRRTFLALQPGDPVQLDLKEVSYSVEERQLAFGYRLLIDGTAGHSGHGAGALTLARPPGPASSLDRGKELCDVEVEEARLFEVRRVAAAWEDD